ncbi:MAG: VWA domain-containing protein [Chloroflexi bacterium]|nr:VWA domain-containing protein [Chloroflexota bacterium]
MTLDFTQPLLLLLLLVLPAFWLIGRISRTHLPKQRRRLVLGVRIAVAALLILGLAGPRIIGRADEQAVAFLVDVSDSVTPPMRERQLQFMRDAMATMTDRDRATIIAFGSQSVLERPLSTARPLGPIASIVDGGKTDIGGAIRLALATLPSTMARKIVVVSDGNENTGKAIEQARVAAAAGVPIQVMPLAQQAGPEVLVRQVETPAFVREGEKFSASINLDASQDTRARVHLLADGRLLSSQDVNLTQGSNTIVMPQEPLPPGFHLFKVQVEASADTYIQNNEGGSYTVVTGKPRVLLIESEGGETRFLAEALQSAGLEVDVHSTKTAVIDLPTLRGYESVVLANVPASELSVSQMRAITSYVQNLGGGLVVVGGEQSYGVGRYNRTPLEEALPVRMDLRGRTLTASVALVLVIDASGSMAGGPGSSKMDLAKEAASRATELLSEQDQLGVISFDDTPRWVVPTNFLEDPSLVQAQIGSIAPGGGTAIFPALETAYNDIVTREAKVRHILLLTDGLSSGGDYDRLTNAMQQNGITLSTIAVGSDADFALMQRLANLGKGRYFEGNDPFEVPQMIVKDTQEVARAAIVEEAFRPAQVGSSPILEGIDVRQMPPLLGYVSTTPKPTSQVLLVSNQMDPVLSEWQYGLGHVVAWTSDVKNRWAQDMLTWPAFSQFWAQVVKRTIPVPVDRNLQVQITQEGATAKVTVDSVADDKTYQNFLRTSATVVDPANGQSQVTIPQVAPGRYETRIPIGGEGAYFLNIVQSDASGAPIAGRPAGFVIPYSQEYRDLRANPDLLGQLAGITSGQVVSDPKTVFERDRRVDGQPRELWPWFLILAALLFLFDVAARRLRLGWMDAELAWSYVLDNWLGRAKLAAAPAASRLLAAKGRISIEGGGLAAGRRGAAARNGPATAGSAVASSRTASSSALGARLLTAKKRAGPAASSSAGGSQPDDA